MQILTFINQTHLLIIICKNFNEIAHDIREKCYSAKHNYNSKDSFRVANWVIISVSNRRESCQCKVATDHKLAELILCVQFKLLNEWLRVRFLRTVGVISFFSGVKWKEEPNAADEICDDHCNNDQPKYFVEVHKDILSNDLFFSRGVVIKELLGQLFDPLCVNKPDQTWQPHKSE